MNIELLLYKYIKTLKIKRISKYLNSRRSFKLIFFFYFYGILENLKNMFAYSPREMKKKLKTWMDNVHLSRQKCFFLNKCYAIIFLGEI